MDCYAPTSSQVNRPPGTKGHLQACSPASALKAPLLFGKISVCLKSFQIFRGAVVPGGSQLSWSDFLGGLRRNRVGKRRGVYLWEIRRPFDSVSPPVCETPYLHDCSSESCVPTKILFNLPKRKKEDAPFLCPPLSLLARGVVWLGLGVGDSAPPGTVLPNSPTT